MPTSVLVPRLALRGPFERVQSPGVIRLSEVIASLSFALDMLDMTEGQPEGHAARSCLIGMRVAEELRLDAVWQRFRRTMAVGLDGTKGARRMFKTRCERGADIARLLEFPEETAEAIRHLDEHWDGRGQPQGLKGREISLARTAKRNRWRRCSGSFARTPAPPSVPSASRRSKRF